MLLHEAIGHGLEADFIRKKTSLFTGRSVIFSGLRQLAIGLAAAAVTFGLGRLLGVSIA